LHFLPVALEDRLIGPGAFTHKVLHRPNGVGLISLVVQNYIFQ
jgi:hypothetical protein